MTVPRLLALVIFFLLLAGVAVGQSQPSDLADLVQFQGAASMNSANASDQMTANAHSRIASSQPSRGSSLGAKPADEQRISRDDQPSFPLGPDSDKTCYFIRDYVVVRDSPHSDSTHRDGSFTCVPGSRFRVYTTGR